MGEEKCSGTFPILREAIFCPSFFFKKLNQEDGARGPAVGGWVEVEDQIGREREEEEEEEVGEGIREERTYLYPPSDLFLFFFLFLVFLSFFLLGWRWPATNHRGAGLP